jgi:hypothetical protein
MAQITSPSLNETANTPAWEIANLHGIRQTS